MIYTFFILIIFLFIGCEKKDESISPVYNEPSLESPTYSINLNWDNDKEKSKTKIDMKWNEWIENDSTEFYKYYILKVKPNENEATPVAYNDISDTTYSTELFSGGGFTARSRCKISCPIPHKTFHVFELILLFLYFQQVNYFQFPK